MPVERNSQSGVCRVIAGSRITARGIASGWRTLSLTLVAVLVTPALAENSPPAIVVGTLIWRTFGAVIGGAAPLTARMPSMPSTLRMSLARQSCTALAPSVIEPPPMVTMRSALALRACSVAAITASRGVCAGIASKIAAQRPPSARLIFSIDIGLAAQRARDHQERAVCAQPIHLLDNSLGRRLAEHDLVHGAENDTPFVHALSSRDCFVVA